MNTNVIWISILVILSFPAQSISQEDKWDTYIASYEKGAGSVVLNMSLKSKAPVNPLSYVLVTGVTFNGCTSDGLPEESQFKILYEISDSIETLIGRMVDEKLAGSFTYQCQRLDYYYIKDTTGVRELLSNLYEKLFPEYKYYVNIKADPLWKYYLDFLYPNEVTLEYMRNQKVIAQLQKNGDKLVKPRQVDHWLFFKSEKDRDTFILYAQKQKFKIENKKYISNEKSHFQLQISRIDKIDLETISKITLELKREAEKLDGSYDGWESFLIKE